jgi:hypothetical protein
MGQIRMTEEHETIRCLGNHLWIPCGIRTNHLSRGYPTGIGRWSKIAGHPYSADQVAGTRIKRRNASHQPQMVTHLYRIHKAVREQNASFPGILGGPLVRR